MGAGKSVFARGIIHALGYSGTVTSPTFTLMNTYEGGLLPVYHFDLYRLNRAEQLYDIGYDEFLYGSGISLIEWAQRMENLFPEEHILVSIEKTGTSTRSITVEDNSGWMLKDVYKRQLKSYDKPQRHKTLSLRFEKKEGG